MSELVRRIAVVGDGLAAWTVGASLAHRMPGASIVMVPAAGRSGVGDLYATAPPRRARLLDAIGISDRELLAAGGVFRLGMRLDGWRADMRSFTIGLGGLGTSISGVPFEALWTRVARRERGEHPAGDTVFPIEAWSPAAVLAGSNRFAPPLDNPRHPFGELEIAMALEPRAHLVSLRNAARAGGVRETATLSVVETADGRISRLRTNDGRVVHADIFVDATGPDAILLRTLPGGCEREDWSVWLTADRVSVSVDAADPALPPIDIAVAEPTGWALAVPLTDRTISARVYDSGLSPDPAAADHIRLDQGRRRRSWIGNCVAIGDAAIEVEPLLATHLAMVHSAVERLLALMPGADCAPVETALYDREWCEECDALRDMLVIAHAVSERCEPYWKSSATLPVSAATTLTLWLERGYLPVRDRELWGREQRIQLLLGAGALPSASDPTADHVTDAQFGRIAGQLRTNIADAVDTAPTHAEIIARLGRPVRPASKRSFEPLVGIFE